MRTNAFHRSAAIADLVAAAMLIQDTAARMAVLSGIAPYRSRGKGIEKTSPSKHCVAMDKRAARKARNVKRHRKACK